MASDHAWLGQVTDDLNDHAGLLDKFGLMRLTNKVDQERMTEESNNAFVLIDANYLAIKGVVVQITNKTTEHDLLFKKVYTAPRAQLQTGVPP